MARKVIEVSKDFQTNEGIFKVHQKYLFERIRRTWKLRRCEIVSYNPNSDGLTNKWFIYRSSDMNLTRFGDVQTLPVSATRVPLQDLISRTVIHNGESFEGSPIRADQEICKGCEVGCVLSAILNR